MQHQFAIELTSREEMLMYPEFVFRATDDCLVKDKIEIFELMSRDKDRLHIYMEDSHFLQ